MRVLLTCPRATVTIEWIRIFKQAGHEVLLVDSLDFPIAKYYNHTRFIKIPAPKLDFEGYKKAILELIKKVDWVIPNCEDIFFLTQIREEIDGNAFLFMPNDKLLFELHNKFQFFKHLNGYVHFPKTQKITSKEQIVLSADTILKPIFSRFGRSVIRDVNQKNTEKLEVSKNYPWVQQQKIEGKAICNYALLLEGEVIAHVAYEPKYLLNGAAATYFEPYSDERLEKFIVQFGEDTHYTGQVAFDFIDNGKQLYVLECNPRATSGIHMLRGALAFVDGVLVCKKNTKTNAYRVGTTLYTLFGLPSLFKGKIRELHHDHKRANDVLDGLPWYAQFLSMWGMLQRAIVYKKEITSASTFDIEYDG